MTLVVVVFPTVQSFTRSLFFSFIHLALLFLLHLMGTVRPHDHIIFHNKPFPSFPKQQQIMKATTVQVCVAAWKAELALLDQHTSLYFRRAFLFSFLIMASYAA
ncbi:MAG: hypothetical protein J3R72DRAFT_66261 [Linnemannia gamsii]|nr:MAG: hypothetical protein J3R72DRAFT_66261 [Linnemannia gamsii]